MTKPNRRYYKRKPMAEHAELPIQFKPETSDIDTEDFNTAYLVCLHALAAIPAYARISALGETDVRHYPEMAEALALLAIKKMR